MASHQLSGVEETALGTQLTRNSELESEYRHAVHVYGSIAAYRSFKPWYLPETIFAFTQLARVQKKALNTLHNFSRNIIAERKHFHKQTNGKYLQIYENIEEDDIFDKDLQSKKRLSMLDLLIAASWKDNQIDEEGIREEVDTFLFAGHDTIASAMTFALSLFAKHTDVQENIRDEVKSIMGEDNNLTISSLQKLSYLERCLKESLRLYPSVHLISRQISYDLQLKRYLIPPGTICEVNIYSLHRRPEYWPNPNVFDPDRFLPENIKGRHPYSYIPFSAGPINCIGQRFAMFELKLFVSFILYNFELEPVDELDDVTFPADLTLTSSKSNFYQFHRYFYSYYPLQNGKNLTTVLKNLFLLIWNIFVSKPKMLPRVCGVRKRSNIVLSKGFSTRVTHSSVATDVDGPGYVG
ncbi:cytochrome P450 4C1-like [Polistes fuscatus]|uniref:cytochrome P450 4C1-like n=1 Tax=Polistes fuscatus TaxID=30207 RepID=UPI001CA8DFF7|nr:cytochrome P450 4C1-like [Polistes fuscatus]